jgi:hypothetical protein
MSFVARELDRISARLRHPDTQADQYEKLYAAQQALAWALDPDGAKSPYDTILTFAGLPAVLGIFRPVEAHCKEI